MVVFQAHAVVFPASAGMIPALGGALGVLVGVPRKRGDDPSKWLSFRLTLWCSPQARG